MLGRFNNEQETPFESNSGGATVRHERYAYGTQKTTRAGWPPASYNNAPARLRSSSEIGENAWTCQRPALLEA